jgi:hypothetical protein
MDLTKPSWSIYDLVNNQDIELFEQVAVECNEIYGFIIDYYILEIKHGEPDPIYGENQNEHFTGPYQTKVRYIPIQEGHVGDEFGIVNINPIEDMWIPKYTFTRDLSGAAIDPKAGDVFYLPWNGHTFQINNVCDEENTFLAKSLVWHFKCKPYKMTNTTGTLPVSAVDIDALTDTLPLSAWGDNVVIEGEGNKIDDYHELQDIDQIYGFK